MVVESDVNQGVRPGMNIEDNHPVQMYSMLMQFNKTYIKFGIAENRSSSKCRERTIL